MENEKGSNNKSDQKEFPPKGNHKHGKGTENHWKQTFLAQVVRRAKLERIAWSWGLNLKRKPWKKQESQWDESCFRRKKSLWSQKARKTSADSFNSIDGSRRPPRRRPNQDEKVYGSPSFLEVSSQGQDAKTQRLLRTLWACLPQDQVSDSNKFILL